MNQAPTLFFVEVPLMEPALFIVVPNINDLLFFFLVCPHPSPLPLGEGRKERSDVLRRGVINVRINYIIEMATESF
jgi:hypothetical protein